MPLAKVVLTHKLTAKDGHPWIVFLREWVPRFSDAGTKIAVHDPQRRRSGLFAILCWGHLLFTILYVPLTWRVGSLALGAAVLAVAALYGTTLALNARGHFTLARAVFFAASAFILVVFSSWLGPQAELQHGIYLLCALPFLLCGPDEIPLRIWGVVLPLGAWLVAELTSYQLFAPAVFASETSVALHSLIEPMIILMSIGIYAFWARGTDLAIGELAHTDRIHRSTLDNLADAVVTIAADGRLRSCNRTAERIWGTRPGGLTGLQTDELILFGSRSGADRASSETPSVGLRTAPGWPFLGCGLGNGAQRFEAHARRKNGEVFPVDIVVTEIPEADEPLAVAVIRDLSTKEAIENQLQAAQQELLDSTRLAAAGEKSGQLAHEILNPITGVIVRLENMIEGYKSVCGPNIETLGVVLDAWQEAMDDGGVDSLLAQLREKSDPIDEEAVSSSPAGVKTVVEADLVTLQALRRFFAHAEADTLQSLRFLKKESDRVVRLVDVVRGLSHRSSTGSRLVVGDLFDELAEIFRDELAGRGIRLEVTSPEGLCVFVDRYEAIQALSNVIRNSINAIAEPKGWIRLEAKPLDQRVQIRVRDSGPGVDPHHAPRLFEAGFTTRSAEQGTGLGLSIARRLLQRWRGDLKWEASPPDVGTTFVAELLSARDVPATGAHGDLSHEEKCG